MVFQAASFMNRVADYGGDYKKYEQDIQETVGELRHLRGNLLGMQDNDYHREAELIATLVNIENAKNTTSKVAAVDLTNKGVKACLGPVGGLITDVAATATRRHLEGEEVNLTTAGKVVGEVAGKEIKKGLGNTLLRFAQNAATTVVGAGAVALAAANAPLIIGGGIIVGGAALATSSTLRDKVSNKVRNFTTGTVALTKEGTSALFLNEKSVDHIIASYEKFKTQKIVVINLKHEKSEETKEKKSIEKRINDIQTEIAKEQSDFVTYRTKSRLARFVFKLNRPTGFYRFLTIIFSWFSRSFRREVNYQKSIKVKIYSKSMEELDNKSIYEQQIMKINRLKDRIFTELQKQNQCETVYRQTLFA